MAESLKAPVLGLFKFRAVLNLAMLLTESQQAKIIRSRLLDIVIDVMAELSGGQTKYINQRDNEYLSAAYQEYSYRQEFTSALSDYLEMGNHKYAVYTNKVYQAIFHENAAEYKKILKLASKDSLRDTLMQRSCVPLLALKVGWPLKRRMPIRSWGVSSSLQSLTSSSNGLLKTLILSP